MIKNEGYIYIFKCIIGSGSDVCKIGKTDNFHRRLKQHLRTPYYGFVPYVEFTTGNPIATIFKVKDYKQADELIDNLFHENQFGNFEIYCIDYDEAIEKMYKGLVENEKLLELIKEDYSSYDFLNNNENAVEKENTKKEAFINIKEQIIVKYGVMLPEELILMLRDKDDYIENCYSHYKRGNYVDFPNNLILDINYNRSKRLDMMNRLKRLL